MGYVTPTSKVTNAVVSMGSTIDETMRSFYEETQHILSAMLNYDDDTTLEIMGITLTGDQIVSAPGQYLFNQFTSVSENVTSTSLSIWNAINKAEESIAQMI
ncbi:MAG: hypothetical protein KKB81_01760 [Candidatus Margulisbacteria bacterium]|nr:hypothetical protein [Candidatus Margulisiibacteriota bacterium]MBU1021642.1 hypothetical protein [Candidatus Margulisiibacteriota bacterium]MBU1728792.1 hypothetical protein [Candidatus Margulisiibacteriota bacterium]MBU1955758.1 hypothetical protein [Candidatus Margulisiibacteriota bacterium]